MPLPILSFDKDNIFDDTSTFYYILARHSLMDLILV